MRWIKLALLALVGVTVALAWPSLVAHSQEVLPSAAANSRSIQLPDRTLFVSTPVSSPMASSGIVQASVSVTVTNIGTRAFLVQSADFTLSAEGDIFGQASASSALRAAAVNVQPGTSSTRDLTFLVPAAALPRAALVYRPLKESLVVSIPLPRIGAATPSSGLMPTRTATSLSPPASTSEALAQASAFFATDNSSNDQTPVVSSADLRWRRRTRTPSSTPTSTIRPTLTKSATSTPTPTVPRTPTATPTSTATTVSRGNSIEDTFARADQVGWGTTTNPDGVPSEAWGMDGNGTESFVTIANNSGVYGYPGASNVVGIASSGGATYNGGDSLVKFAVSTVGHVIPYVVQNACSDKSCYYGARLDTSQNQLELAKRVGNVTSILATAPFTASANTYYWMRLDVTGGTTATLRAKVWADGTPEPSAWQVTAADGSPLAANLVGAGGSWNQAGAGEQIRYVCYAYAASGLAMPCGTGPVPTATPTSISSSTATPSPTPTGTVQEFLLNGGVGDPWGTAIDAAGNVWFAEPGCDFSPTCPSTTPPGQLGEFLAGSKTLRWYTLPNISGNQPIFVTLDNMGNVWFTTPNNSMIGEFNPATQSLVGQWAVTVGSGPWDLTFANGKIWYTEHFVSAVGEFDVSTHTYQDFTTPSASSNPYGIAASGSLVWFTENNSTVARIAKLDTANNNQISEYLIRSSLPWSLTPHLLALDANGHPWWTEGWVRAIGTLDPQVATSGVCGTSVGDCTGVTEFALPSPPPTCGSSHVSGIAVANNGALVWLDDSLSAQVGNYNRVTHQFTLYDLANCNAHPHDGLNLDAASPPHVWWDEEFANALGELSR